MALLPRVELHLPDSVSSYVAYTVPGEAERSTDLQIGSSVTHSLRGAPAEVTVAWRALADLGDGFEQVCEGEVETGSLPAGLDDLEVLVEADEDLAGPEWLLASMGDGPFIAVFDRQGRIRWYAEGDEDRLVVDVQLGLDGDRVLFNQFDPTFEQDLGVVKAVDLDGEPIEEHLTPQAHHVFVQHGDGTLGWLALDIREFTDPDSGEVDMVGGDAIVERSPEGVDTVVSTVWDWPELEPDLDDAGLGLYPDIVDWTHGNALKLVDDGSAYLMSMANADLVARVDRATGQPLELYGSQGLRVEEGSTPIDHQHDPTLLDEDHLLLFISSVDPPGSGAVEYEIDREAGVLREVWRYGFFEGSFNPILGQAIELGEGLRLVNFGLPGEVHLVSSEGSAAWVVKSQEGQPFRQMVPFPGFWVGG